MEIITMSYWAKRSIHIIQLVIKQWILHFVQNDYFLDSPICIYQNWRLGWRIQHSWWISIQFNCYRCLNPMVLRELRIVRVLQMLNCWRSWKIIIKHFITDVKQLRCFKIVNYLFLNQQRSCWTSVTVW